MTAFKEFAIGKFVLRFYKTDHVWTCTVTEDMLDEVKKELALQKLSDISQEIENEPVAWISVLAINHIGQKFTDVRVSLTKTDVADIPLYTHPMRELTEDEIREVADSVCHTWKKNGVGELYMTDFARAILKKASEK